MSKRKPIIAMDISTTGIGGGPYTSTMNIVNSRLKDDYDYQIFKYKTEIGRFISIKRIVDIAAQLKKINPDIVHFTGMQFSGFHIAVACKLAGVKRNVVVIRGSSTEAMNISRYKRWILYLLEVVTLAITTTYYGVSRYTTMLPITRSFRGKSSGHIYNIPTFFTDDEELNRVELGFTDDDIVIVTVARIIKDKGYHILKDSIKKLECYNNIKFLIVGDGTYLPEMREELAKMESDGRVVFLGYRSDVAAILKCSDIFVLPTLHETLSNSLLEASQYELALIASNVGGVPEIVDDGVNGLLVPPSDVDSLANAIKSLVDNPEKIKEMGSAAKDKLKTNFSEESITEKIDNVYKMLLNK